MPLPPIQPGPIILPRPAWKVLAHRLTEYGIIAPYKYYIKLLGAIFAKRTNFGIPNEINAVWFRRRGDPGSLATRA
jgi:hypothetical protein